MRQDAPWQPPGGSAARQPSTPPPPLTCAPVGVTMGYMATKTERLNVRIGSTLREDMEQAADDQDMTMGEFVRFALTRYFELYPVTKKEEA